MKIHLILAVILLTFIEVRITVASGSFWSSSNIPSGNNKKDDNDDNDKKSNEFTDKKSNDKKIYSNKQENHQQQRDEQIYENQKNILKTDRERNENRSPSITDIDDSNLFITEVCDVIVVLYCVFLMFFLLLYKYHIATDNTSNINFSNCNRICLQNIYE